MPSPPPPTGTLDLPVDERFERVTRLACHVLGVPKVMVVLDDDRPGWSEYDIVSDEIVFERDHEEPVHLHVVASHPVVAPGGDQVGSILVLDHRPSALSDAARALLADIAHVVDERLEALLTAHLDSLTRVANRRGFELVAEKVLDLSLRIEHPVTLVYFDVDGLKRVNDSQGHAAGDRVLRDFASLLRRTFRNSDVIARIGGDEFAVLLTGAAAATPAVEHLRAAIREHNRTTRPTGPLSVACGAATFDPTRDSSLDHLLRRADRAMYEDKHGLRDDCGSLRVG